MTKNESPTNQGKLPNKDLFGDALLGHTVGLGDKFTLSSKNEEMLTYFNTLSGKQRSEVLRNLRADKEEGEFIDNKITNEKN
jgi:hypothetical protein